MTEDANTPAPRKGPTADQVTFAYINLRDKRKELKDAYEAADAELVAKMDKIEVWLLMQLDALGADSLKTEHGTAYISTRDRATCGDWGTFWEWAAANGRVDMLEKRVATKPVAEYLEQYGELPPGISIERERSVTIRRA